MKGKNMNKEFIESEVSNPKVFGRLLEKHKEFFENRYNREYLLDIISATIITKTKDDATAKGYYIDNDHSRIMKALRTYNSIDSSDIISKELHFNCTKKRKQDDFIVNTNILAYHHYR